MQNEPSPLAAHWTLDPSIAFLNHGSFGACPRVVLERQAELLAQMEAEPVRFLVRQMLPLLDASRRRLAALIGGRQDDVAFVGNATAAVNAVVRSIRWRSDDRILVTDHGYNACTNVARAVAQREPIAVDTAALPFPIRSSDEAVDAVLGAVTPRTRVAIIDHVTSPTGLVLPVERIAPALAERGVDVLIDGAHAPGMVPIDVHRLGCAYYAGNCHKWLCAPKGAGFLWARADRQADLLPPVVSHGFNVPRPGRSRFTDLFDWPGTLDPTPWLCVGEAIAFVESLMPGGLDALRAHNRELALTGRRILCDALGVEPPAPDDMIGSLAAVELPDDPAPEARYDPGVDGALVHTLQSDLLERDGIEVPAIYWPTHPRRLVRISAQAYNSAAQYERLAAALTRLLADERVQSSP